MYSCQAQELTFENSEFVNGILVSRDNQVPVNGNWVETKDGVLILTGKFRDGKHDGLFTSFWPSGSISDSVTYMDGKKHGIEAHYDSTGVKRTEIPYLFGEEHGVVREYTALGNLEQETRYELGVKSGVAIGYYWTGQVKDSVCFTNGLENGTYVKYFFAGAENSGNSLLVQETGEFNAGVRVGVWRENLAGQDYIERNYSDRGRYWSSLPENMHKTYDFSYERLERHEDGALKKIERGYVCDGKTCGDNQVNYYVQNDAMYKRLFSIGEYVDGMRHGLWETDFYDHNGAKSYEVDNAYHYGRTEEEWNNFYRSSEHEAIGLQGVWNVSVTQTYHFGTWDQYPEIKRGSYEVAIVKELGEESYSSVFLSDAIPSESWLKFPTFTPTNTEGVWECKSTYCGQYRTNSIALQQGDHLITFDSSVDFSQFKDYCMDSQYRRDRVDLEVTMVRVAPKTINRKKDERNSTNRPQSTASCVVVDAENGYLVTNFHAINESGQHAIFFEDTEFEVTVVAEDVPNDLALLKLKKPIQGLLELSISTNDGLGSDVYAVGYPLQSEMGLDVKVTEGLISSVSFLGNTNMYQISCPITFGNSGGALLDDKGNLAGITQGGYRPDMETENVNGAVKAHSIITLAQGSPECQLSLGDRSKKIDFDQLDKSVLVLRSY